MNTEMHINDLKLLKNLYILLVEDDENMLDDIKSTIELFCDNVYTASNGKEALKIIEKSHIDMIISDYVMPYMDGYELCKTVRLSNQNIPIVIISNFNENEKLLNLITLNLTEYLVKPISYTSLTTVLLKMLQKLYDNNLVFEQLTPNLKYNHIDKTLTNKSQVLPLTKNEIAVLELFLKNKNSLVSNSLIKYNLENEELSNQAIKNIIHRLRIKIGKKLIVNIKEMGYMLIFNQ